ncbi:MULTISPECIES: CNNM family magnesium/cobalt transport protein CorC [unclassified Vibrio]|uniref:CNNM family magnesium/cobalt transport protein CorC n=1 Tax=unclassified Vibrio TaxID=2614977 RepID=UPI001482C253|nr:MULTISPECIES: CNNM family magnesium/cobalt transport protein CorC [unclassified Vibrio]MDQ2194356.1 CNNM family magnesium/cobalt transport protein CorC [Vibrio sp. A14(2019)]MDQ2195474.1 CNNM family magnesium/cobalt transport protein CorC [Vibrio sp. 2017_1457_11]NNN74559.1 CNNM family magnesium/cobalt transport protein CorC [Vibrio sp. B7]NNN91012.1 CNNM family magnesium/cobalt transport protein CorC [Vibrio sp. B8-1]NNO06515.1 CNNM family magnesium/cobalt transport protein CorC [Vibrio sp
MNEDNPQNSEGPSRKSFFERLGQLFQGDPRDRQELVDVIRDSEINDLIDHDTRDMLEGVMEISEMRVRDIMIPRSQMVTIDKNDDLDTLIALITDAQHSRYPVISEDKDHVEGILLAKDLLKYLGSDSAPFNILEVIRPAVVVPESKRVDRLLKEFREERYHMAIVVDEFGGVSGLVTIEDILEEIVGDIEDEFDDEEQLDIRKLSKHTFAVKALTTIEEFNETFGTKFSDEEVDTVGGLVMTAFGHLPSRGEVVEIDKYSFKVTAADNRRVVQLQVTIPDLESLSVIAEE